MSATSIYIVYETTNLVNGKYYIGVHKINGSNYLGSGTILKQAIMKYGRNNFMRETLKEFTNNKDAYRYERLIVDKQVINNHNCYNIIEGGLGYTNGSRVGKLNPMYGKHHSNKSRKNISINNKGKCIGKSHFRSKTWLIHGKLFYSGREAGEYFNVTRRTVKYWCETYIPHCYRI